MSYTASDFNLMVDDHNYNDRTDYTIPSETFTAGNLYIMILGSGDVSIPGVPVTVVTAGLTWTKFDSIIRDSGSQTTVTLVGYWAKPVGNTTSDTVITYDSQQNRCLWQIVEITKSSEIIQSVSGLSPIATRGITVTLTDPVTSTSLVLSSFMTSEQVTWTAGGGQTLLSPGVTEFNFVQYNLGTYEALPATIDTSITSISGIGVEIAEVGITPETVTEMYTLNLTDDGLVGGNAVIHESTVGFDAGVTVELWPADVEANAETASAVVALSVDPTSTPQYNVTFSVAADNAAGDTVHFIYLSVADGGAGDMKSVTGGNALASGTFDGTNAMVCP